MIRDITKISPKLGLTVVIHRLLVKHAHPSQQYQLPVQCSPDAGKEKHNSYKHIRRRQEEMKS